MPKRDGKKRRKREEEEEPITYCARCYSIKIKYEDSVGVDCCGDCGCTDFRTIGFDEWENMYVRRYGHKYLEVEGNIKQSPIFLLTIPQLKAKVYGSPNWREICKAMYPSFPEGISKADSVVLLFAKLCQDGKMDDLRIELINQNKK